MTQMPHILKAKICLTGDTIRQIDIVSRCFENIIIYKLTNPYLATLRLGRPGIRVARIGEFVNNKQMSFLQSFVLQ